MTSPFQQLHKLGSQHDSIFSPGARGNLCGMWIHISVSSVSPSTHFPMRVAAQGATGQNHSQAGLHSASFHSHHKGIFCQQGNMLYIQYRLACNVYVDINRGLFAWCPLRWDQCFHVLSWREEHGWGTRELLSHQINNTLVVKVSRLHYGPFLNPCDVILLRYRYTDRLMGKCVRYLKVFTLDLLSISLTKIKKNKTSTTKPCMLK